jgi:hypothetical protein
MNGFTKGSNITADQSSYDLVFKDIIVSSDKRNIAKYPNPNMYTVDLNINIDKIYKAELIEVYIPAATDSGVNIQPTANTLWFTYNGVGYSVVVQAGTYLSPVDIANEISRLFLLIPLPLSLNMQYNENLNRYGFYDSGGANVVLDILGNNNIAPVLNFTQYNSYSINKLLPLVSGPKSIMSDINNNLYVSDASGTPYGSVLINNDPVYSNVILSNIVLTDCRIYLSIGKLDGDTISQISSYNNAVLNIPSMFCQIPNNSLVSSSRVKTLLSQPSVYSSIQFYNPPVSGINKLNITWYAENGTLLRLLEHCFTIRIYYFQKRNNTTAFSIPLLNYPATGTQDSIFQPIVR